MADQAILSIASETVQRRPNHRSRGVGGDHGSTSGRQLAVSITKLASKQTHATVRYLVDRGRKSDAFRAYAYFRWVDDQLDEGVWAEEERLAFLKRQRDLVDRLLRGEWIHGLTAQEKMLADLILNSPEADTGLYSYVRSMMSVMAFDAERKGRLISQEELASYTRNLAIAVTEALHYFIGHDEYSPGGKSRYLAATAAHITHMLRDTWADTAAGYYNIPCDFLESHQVTAEDITSDAYQAWVRQRVNLAREYFALGKQYLSQVESFRCRIAGFAYIGRFEIVLDEIEKDGYRLRPSYDKCKSLGTQLRMGWKALRLALDSSDQRVVTYPVPTAH